MNLILLSGGSGQRLWPLSNDIRSKQFIKFFRKENGEYESMLQRMYRQIKNVDPEAKVTIATSKSQVSAINNQIGSGASISIEPCRRDTFPAIALAAAYLHDVKSISEDEAVVVCPVDPFVEKDYFETLMGLSEQAKNGAANLMLMGIDPIYPSEKYGYIIPKNGGEISEVLAFKEKPDYETARKYIACDALWNGGVFAFKLKYLLDKANELLGCSDYKTLYDSYEKLEKISFDYAVVEKESDIKVMRFNGQWKDIGTWSTLTEIMDEASIGKSIIDEKSENVHVLNELDVPVICIGLKDIVVSASPEGILVSNKKQSDTIKKYVDSLDNQIMFAEKSWGSYRVLDIESESLTIKVTLNAGHKMNYHSHELRDEVWNIISGEGIVLIDGKSSYASAGDVFKIPAGVKHTVKAVTELKIIEVQLGKDIDVHDKIKFDKV